MNKILPVGSFKQKASPVMSYFVVICLVVTVGLLFVMQRSEAISDSFMSVTYYSDYIE